MPSSDMRAEDYDPFAEGVVADPYPWYRLLHQRRAPVRCRDRDLWVIARYDQVRAAARDTTTFSSAEGIAYTRVPLPMMITSDPPDHTRLRRIVARDFTPRAVEQWEPVVQRLVDRHLEELLDARGGDFVETVAGPLPVLVIAEILGVPTADRKQFKQWSDDLVAAFRVADDPDPASTDVATAAMALQSIVGYFRDLADERRQRPGTDLLSRLVAQEPEALSADEIAWMGLLLLVAGHETTTNLLGNLLLALTQSQGIWQQLRDDPGLVPAAVEEGLRHGSPVQGFFRTAREDHEVGGEAIPAGSRALLLFAAANRDPEQFEDPDIFTLGRGLVEHVAFGYGPHHCLGAAVARLETHCLLDTMLGRVRSIELAGTPQHTRNPTLRGLQQLPISIITS